MIICRCNEVTLKEIEEFMKKHPNATMLELATQTTASTGCGRCSVQVRKIYDRIKKSQSQNDQFRISF